MKLEIREKKLEIRNGKSYATKYCHHRNQAVDKVKNIFDPRSIMNPGALAKEQNYEAR